MRARNLVNPEAIDELIRIIAGEYKRLPLGLAYKALRRPLRNEACLYTPVTERPQNAPAWITSEIIASGALEFFDRNRWTTDLLTDLMNLAGWLDHGHRQATMGPNQRRKWEAGLAHIRNLEEARTISKEQVADWNAADARESLRKLMHIMKPLMRFREQIVAGHIVERAKLECGARWFELLRYQSLRNEAAEMNSCIDRPLYGMRLLDGHARFFTLRHADLSPRLSLMVMHDRSIEAAGPGNKRLDEKSSHEVRRFIDVHCPHSWPKSEPKRIDWPKSVEMSWTKLPRSSPLAQELIRLGGDHISEDGLINLPQPFWKWWRIVDA